MKYILYTSDGDKWEFEEEEEARKNQYIFGGTIIRKDEDNGNQGNERGSREEDI